MKQNQIIILTTILLLTLLLVGADQVQAQDEPIIRAVLFYSPSCPHCLDVINNTLPPLVDQYGTQLQIFGVDTYTAEGGVLFQQTIDKFQVPENQRGVPMLIISDQMLMGSVEIPEKLPGIIEQGLEDGGIDWPEIPGLQEAMMAAEQNPTNQADPEPINPTFKERFTADLSGNILSVVVLIGMIGTVVRLGFTFQKSNPPTLLTGSDWLIPILAVIGAGIAAYLGFVEYTETEAICGPIGKCNSVQQSQYAYLFGVIPIGIFGLVGYFMILLSWLLKSIGLESWKEGATYLLWAMTLFGISFSIYLTFLEPFVIGASCIWCLGSAVIMTILFVLTTHEVKKLFNPAG